ncbi:TPA: SDR family oxidoreductase [Clostridium perfringens]|uniref:3-oxoacyl-[acyl-carrier-protein] reductase n=1 Tax=Clostridium perfringens (strain 13 / Type A) TaxID=195102 RepID=Q8XJ34_CLOPE|nr:SDR family oxidoreductase [Clostridium perfringens]EJT5926787.1 SDR family oxidoreductase [Clostridium perfringens]EJT6151066.1 SDR family oxidoreductase [Clostridium perfringens]EJT6156752.1 SDR family oxidoreductase [Clostridium perfringens]EJT6481573.1 SDR family oxidoreductase [Clostridium perfringens]MDH5085439.1 Glucose 1-dehydrogenase 2 [Clostridium perfringens]
MEKKLLGKIVYITGASKGIGRGIAREFGKSGAFVLVGYNSDLEGANETLNMIKELGGSGEILGGNVANKDERNNIVSSIKNKFGKLDVLVNNAGISKIGLFMDASDEEIDSIMNVNLIGAMKLTRDSMDLLREGSNSSIINISSIWGNVGASCEVLYSTTKGGMNLFTKALAKEIAPWGIRVNCIAPGVINTEMNSWLSKEEKEGLEEEIPMNRFGEVEEIGRVAKFLASEDSSYLTGQILTVDGGML